MPTPSTLGIRLLLARREAGLTQKALAHKAGIGVMTIYRLERGHYPSVGEKLIRRLCAALGCSADYLVGLSDDRGGGVERWSEGPADVQRSPLRPGVGRRLEA